MIDRRFSRPAEFGYANFTLKLDSGGEEVTFLGCYDYKRDSAGVHLVGFEYWPRDPEVEELVRAHVLGLLKYS